MNPVFRNKSIESEKFYMLAEMVERHVKMNFRPKVMFNVYYGELSYNMLVFSNPSSVRNEPQSLVDKIDGKLVIKRPVESDHAIELNAGYVSLSMGDAFVNVISKLEYISHYSFIHPLNNIHGWKYFLPSQLLVDRALKSAMHATVGYPLDGYTIHSLDMKIKSVMNSQEISARDKHSFLVCFFQNLNQAMDKALKRVMSNNQKNNHDAIVCVFKDSLDIDSHELILNARDVPTSSNDDWMFELAKAAMFEAFSNADSPLSRSKEEIERITALERINVMVPGRLYAPSIGQQVSILNNGKINVSSCLVSPIDYVNKKDSPSCECLVFDEKGYPLGVNDDFFVRTEGMEPLHRDVNPFLSATLEESFAFLHELG